MVPAGSPRPGAESLVPQPGWGPAGSGDAPGGSPATERFPDNSDPETSDMPESGTVDRLSLEGDGQVSEPKPCWAQCGEVGTCKEGPRSKMFFCPGCYSAKLALRRCAADARKAGDPSQEKNLRHHIVSEPERHKELIRRMRTVFLQHTSGARDHARRSLAATLLVSLKSVVAVQDECRVRFMDKEQWVQYRILDRGWTKEVAAADFDTMWGIADTPRQGALLGMRLAPDSVSLMRREHSVTLSGEVQLLGQLDGRTGVDQVRQHAFGMHTSSNAFADMGAGAWSSGGFAPKPQRPVGGVVPHVPGVLATASLVVPECERNLQRVESEPADPARPDGPDAKRSRASGSGPAQMYVTGKSEVENQREALRFKLREALAHTGSASNLQKLFDRKMAQVVAYFPEFPRAAVPPLAGAIDQVNACIVQLDHVTVDDVSEVASRCNQAL